MYFDGCKFIHSVLPKSTVSLVLHFRFIEASGTVAVYQNVQSWLGESQVAVQDAQ
jgi:hypothetical protein